MGSVMGSVRVVASIVIFVDGLTMLFLAQVIME